MNKNHKRISAAVLSLALGFTIAGAPMLAPVAGAQTASQNFIVDSAQINDIVDTANVSLTINKYEGLPVEDLATLNGITPLEATFQVEKLDLDLTQIADWQTLAALTPDTVATDDLDSTFTPANLTTTGGTATLSTTPTGAENETVDSNFTMGAYLVTEQDKFGYRIADPFLVVLPHLETDGTWSYNQTASPKNQAISLQKDVADAGLTLGKNITYTIAAAVPGGDLTQVEIVDNLPAELGAASGVQVYTKTDALPETTRDDFPLNADPVLTDGDGNELRVTFNATDLAELQTRRNDNPNLQLIVEFQTQIVMLPSTGVIQNDASINFPGVTFSTEDNDVPDNGAETRLGSLVINNIDADGNPIPDPDTTSNDENDAIFEIFRCTTADGGTTWTASGDAIPALAGEGADSVTTVTDLENYLADKSLTSLPTEFYTVDGKVELYGVQLYNFVNGEQLEADSSLCAVQQQEPNGYEPNPDPQPAGPDTTTLDEYDMVVDVTNLQEADIDITLPATGGQGTLAMIAAGLLVAVAGGFAALRGNRARK